MRRRAARPGPRPPTDCKDREGRLGYPEPGAEGTRWGRGDPGSAPRARGAGEEPRDWTRPAPLPAPLPARPGVAAAAPSIVRGRGGGGGEGKGRPRASPPASSGTGCPASPPLARASGSSLDQYLRSRCPAAPASAAEVPPPPSLNSAALSTASGLPVALLPEEPLLGNALSNGIPSEVVTRGARSSCGRRGRRSPGQ